MNTQINTTLSQMGLTMDTVFIPFSQSRNKAEKSPSLNWKVTIKKNGRDILTTDYMAGCGHCPSYTQGKMNYDKQQVLKAECETGYKNKYGYSLLVMMPDKKHPILPKIEDVVYSLVMDSEAMDYDFSEWCASFGYEEDSRKAESIYNQCTDIALKIVRAIGTDGLNTLREIYQDY